MRRRYVVTGPLGSGTSTYVHDHAQPGDLVWDWDIVGAALTPELDAGKPVLGPPWLVALLAELCEALLLAIELGGVDPPGIFIIATRTTTANQIAARIHAEVIPVG